MQVAEPVPVSQVLWKVPRHVGIIMDGNGRWAQERGLPRSAGHQAGTKNLRPVIEAAVEFGIEALTLYAFSTENWRRPRDEIDALMSIMSAAIRDELGALHENGVRIRHLGRVEGVPAVLLAGIRHAVELTRNNTRLALNIAFNYGGRADIVDAVRSLMRRGLSPDQIDENEIAGALSTAGLPDLDLVIRTSGEMRLSNFLIWEAAYAEYYSSPVYFPDFGRDELLKALLAYQSRDRKYGGLSS